MPYNTIEKRKRRLPFLCLLSRLSASAWSDLLRPVGSKRQSRALDCARDDRGERGGRLLMNLTVGVRQCVVLLM